MRARGAILVLLGLLAAGAVANLGVALALFATGEPISIRRQTRFDLASGTEHVRRGTIWTINGAAASDTQLPGWLDAGPEGSGWHARITPGRWAGQSMVSIRSAAGWPMPSLLHVPPPPGSGPLPAPGAALPQWFAMSGGRVPRSIYWPGFAANTAIYAAVLALPFAVLPVRSALRIRRGRCPRCGYDLTGCTRCPECGGGGGEPAPSGAAGHGA